MFALFFLAVTLAVLTMPLWLPLTIRREER